MNQFRIDESQLRSWHVAAAARTDVRGIAAVAKELEAHLARKDADGTIVVSRHQLFTWAEALQGAAARGGGPPLQAACDDMRSVLAGRASGAPPAAPGPASAPAAAFAMPPAPAPLATAPLSRQMPPAVQYVTPGALPTPTLRGGALVATSELAATARELIRGATSELLVISPWATGLETLAADIAALPPTVQVRIVSRRPEREDAPYHQAMEQLGRRRTVTAFSGHIQTRMIVADGTRALVGAASIPPAMSREVGVLLTDAASAGAARAHFERVFSEATAGR